MHKKSWQFVILVFCVTWLIAYSQINPFSTALHPPVVAPATQVSAPQATLLVSAAASLQKALQEITKLDPQTDSAPEFNSKINAKINYNFAASGVLQQQIEQGAPVDVFISAAEKQILALEKKGLLVSGTKQNLLTNRLVLIVPKQSKILLKNFQELVNPEVQRIAIAEPRTVPAGQYASEVLQNLGIWEQVQSKFVFGNNVKSVLTTVETGDVDAGFVYSSDAKGSDKVTVVAIADEKLHSPIRYPIAILRSSNAPELSKKYVDFLKSDSAKAVFEKYGFGIAQN